MTLSINVLTHAYDNVSEHEEDDNNTQRNQHYCPIHVSYLKKDKILSYIDNCIRMRRKLTTPSFRASVPKAPAQTAHRVRHRGIRHKEQAVDVDSFIRSVKEKNPLGFMDIFLRMEKEPRLKLYQALLARHFKNMLPDSNGSLKQIEHTFTRPENAEVAALANTLLNKNNPTLRKSALEIMNLTNRPLPSVNYRTMDRKEVIETLQKADVTAKNLHRLYKTLKTNPPRRTLYSTLYKGTAAALLSPNNITAYLAELQGIRLNNSKLSGDQKDKIHLALKALTHLSQLNAGKKVNGMPVDLSKRLKYLGLLLKLSQAVSSLHTGTRSNQRFSELQREINALTRNCSAVPPQQSTFKASIRPVRPGSARRTSS